MNWVNITYLIIGAALGFGGSLIVEFVKRFWDKKDQKKKNQIYLNGLGKEIREGIERCEGIIRMLKNRKISFSRIYIEFWKSTKSELSQNLKDIETLKLLYQIYYRFDLINFNMEMDRPGPGAAFAKQYLNEIKENFNKLKDIITKS